jgi:CDP-glucose 4,6-dehydratase
MSIKNILITGITGFIGYHLIQDLLNKDYFIHGVSRFIPDTYKANLSKHKNVFLYDCDLTNSDDVFKKIGQIKFDYVFHLAADNRNRHTDIPSINIYKTNIIGTINIIETIMPKSPKCLFCFTSSLERVKDNYGPFNPYHISKTTVEMIISSYIQNNNLNAIILKLNNIYGPADQNWNRLIPSIFRSIYSNSQLNLSLSKNHEFNFLFVTDLISLFIQILNTPLQKFNKANFFIVKSKENLTLQNILTSISTLFYLKKLPLITYSPVNKKNRLINLNEVKPITAIFPSWKEAFTFNTGIKTTKEWYASLKKTTPNV